MPIPLNRRLLFLVALPAIVVATACNAPGEADGGADGDRSDIVDTRDTGEDPNVAGEDFLTADPTNKATQRGDMGAAPGNGPPSEDAGADRGGANREIVESDVYALDGNTLYVVNRYRGLVAVDLTDKAAPKIAGRLGFRGTPTEMYLRDGRAYVLLQSYESWNFDGGAQGSGLLVVDVRNPARPQLAGFFRTPGQIVDSRLVGDVIYLVSSGYYYNDGRPYYQTADCGQFLANGIPAPQTEPAGATWGYRLRLYSVNIADPANVREVDSRIIGGNGQVMTVTQNHVFVADPNWGDARSAKVQVFDISDAGGTIRQRGEIPTVGYVGDRWKLHEYNGALFAVSQVWGWNGNGREPGVWMESFSLGDRDFGTKLDEYLLKSNEQAFATRYDGARAYVVTYMRVDPLFVLDIADPRDIKVLGELVIPGWSTHIEPRGDKLLAVGRDDSAGRGGSRVQVSLFDVADPTRPQELSKIVIGENDEYTYSEANNDWKAFKVWDSLGLITLPVQIWSREWNTQAARLYLVDFNRQALRTRGHVDSRGQVQRGVPYDGHVLSISDQNLQVIDIANRDNPIVRGELRLARFVDAVLSVGGRPADLGGGWYDRSFRLTQYDPASPDKAVYESEALDVSPNSWWYGSQSKVRRAGDKLFITTLRQGSYDANGAWVPRQTVLLTAFEAPAGAEPRKLYTVELPDAELPADLAAELQSRGGYGWWYGAYGNSDVVVTESGAALVLLRFEGWYPVDAQGRRVPTGAPWAPGWTYRRWSREALLAYDIRNPAAIPAPRVLDDYAPAVDFDDQPWFYYGYTQGRPSLFTLGSSQALFTTCEDAGRDAAGNDIARCFAQGLELADPATPASAFKINIPGLLARVNGDEWQSIAGRWENVTAGDGSSSWRTTGALYVLKREGDRVRLLHTEPVLQSYEGNSWRQVVGKVGDPVTDLDALTPYKSLRDWPLFDDASGTWLVREESQSPAYVSVYVGERNEQGGINYGQYVGQCTVGDVSARQRLRYLAADGTVRDALDSTDPATFWAVQAVQNGGVLLTRTCGGSRGYGGYYYGPGRGGIEGDVGVAPPRGGGRKAAVVDDCLVEGEKWKYIAPDGRTAEGFVPQSTYYQWYWYSYGTVPGTFAAIREGDALYVARGWDAVVKMPLTLR